MVVRGNRMQNITIIFFILVIGMGYWVFRETPSRRASRLLHELASLPGGNIDILYFGRSPREIQEDWDRLDIEALPALLHALHDSNPRKRYLAAGKIGDLGDHRGVVPLVQSLGDEDFLVRTWAATALGKIGDPLAIEPVIGCLFDESVSVRQAAIEALGRLGDSRAVEPLIQVLGDKELVIRVEAIRSLGLLGDRKAINPILALLEKDDSDMIHSTGAQAIKKLSSR